MNKTKNLKLKTFLFVICYLLFVICSPAVAATPTASPSATIAPASPSATIAPTGPEEKKVQEMRQIVKDINEIKEKIEKKGYVGKILEITDSTLTITNFRGKQRVRIIEGTVIVGANKKEIPMKDLALEDKIIALGEPDTNDTLDAKRITVVALPKIVPAKRLIFYGKIKQANTKTTTLTLTSIKSVEKTLEIKIDKTSYLVNQKDQKVVLKFSDFSEGQKAIIIYPETAAGKIPLAKSVFLLP